MKRVLLVIVVLLISSIFLVACSKSKNLTYDVIEVKSISFYSLSGEGWQLKEKIEDESKKIEFLEKLSKIQFTRYSGDVKAKSTLYIKITFNDDSYEEIDEYRILSYDKNNNLIKNLKYRCSEASFSQLYVFFAGSIRE